MLHSVDPIRRALAQAVHNYVPSLSLIEVGQVVDCLVSDSAPVRLRLKAKRPGGVAPEVAAAMREMRSRTPAPTLLEIADEFGVCGATAYHHTKDIKVFNPGNAGKKGNAKSRDMAKAYWIDGLTFDQVGLRYRVSKTTASKWARHHKAEFRP